MIRLTGHDNAIIGTGEFFGQGHDCFVYSKQTILENLMKDGMIDDEALEFYDFNILGGHFGEGNPIFLDTSLNLADIVDDDIVEQV